MTFGFSRGQRFRLLAGVLEVLVPCVSLGADWRFTPYLDLAETYTDNVTLRERSGAESDYVTEIDPGFSLNAQGRELQLSFGYRMQNLIYANDDSRNSINHQMQARAHSALAQDWLFLDADASLSQQVLDPNAPISTGNIASIGNREDVFSSSVSPNVKLRLGPVALGTVRYTQAQTKYSGTIAEDSVTDSVEVRISAAHPLGAWTGNVEILKDETQYFGVRSDESRERMAMNLGYRISYKILVTGTLGREENKYDISSSAAAPQGDSWNAGFVWTPSPLTSMTVGAGQRYFGNTKNFSLSHRGRRNEWQLSYLDDLSSLRQYVTYYGDFFVYDPITKQPKIDPISGSLEVIHNPRYPLDEVFIRHRGDLHWKVHSRKLAFNSSIYLEKREYQRSGVEERLGGGDMGYEWRASRLSSVSINWGRQNSARSSGVDKFKFTNLSWEHSLGQKVSSSIDLRHTERHSTGGGSDYAENLITGRLRMTW